MNGIHDLGGMHGFGPVVREDGEPVFHADWEGRVLAMNVVALAQRLYNVDEFRHGVERMGAAHYLASGYYEHWLASVETLLLEKGVVSREELDARIKALRDYPDASLPRREDPDLLRRMLAHVGKLGGSRGEASPAPAFKPGDRVRTRNVHPAGHTRLPRYARGRLGTIGRFHGVYTFPDAHARGRGRQPEPLYGVAFASGDLWGESAEPHQQVHLDLWEPYLEPA